MYSLRKWFYRPKKEDTSRLAMFYWADEELTMVAAELDSFDGRTDPDRCSVLVTQLRLCQDKVLSICNEIMDEAIPDMRANRDFRAKFPDDVLHENLAGQLWFGAECLAAGSNIIHRELESASMRPLAKALTRALDNVRCLLRAQSLKNSQEYSDKVREALRIFDRLFAEFELSYVSAMVPIKSAKEYHLQQEIVVLFSETLIRGLQFGLIEQEMIDDYDPSLMFTIPRLAIVWGLLVFPDGPFNIDRDPEDISELFRPFCSLLSKIRDLLWTLTRTELSTLEKMLCSQEEPKMDQKSESAKDAKIGNSDPFDSTEDYINKFCLNHSNCKQFVQDFYLYNFGTGLDEDGNNEADVDAEVLFPSKNSSSKATWEVRNIHNRQGYSTLSNPQEEDFERLMPPHLRGSRNSLLSFSDAQQSMNRHLLPKDSGESKGSRRCMCERSARGEASSSCDRVAKYKGCTLCRNEVGSPIVSSSSPTSAVSLECRLNQLHSQCSCGLGSSSPLRRPSPSRTLMRQVMSRVEIVPAGHHGYSSSPEGSPRAYHHGLLSHSFPAQQEYSDMLSEHGYVPNASSAAGKRRHRLSSSSNRSLRIDCDISPAGLHCSSPCSMSYSSCKDFGSHVNSAPLAIPARCSDSNKSCDVTYSSCSSCQSISSVSSPELNSTSPETSSYNSECQDDEEIALALQAAEIASRNRVRARFKSSKDLLHKLFVCISGIADQLQTNYASDLRNILKSVFDINCSQNSQSSSDSENSAAFQCKDAAEDQSSHPAAAEEEICESSGNNTASPSHVDVGMIEVVPEQVYEFSPDEDRDHSSVDSAEEALPDSPTSLVITDISNDDDSPRSEYGPPAWVPDDMSSHCMACEIPFTLLRRRHHCRNCGKIFCSRCSSNSIPLPRFGHLKPVRVCNQCFMYQLTSLVIQQQQQS